MSETPRKSSLVALYDRYLVENRTADFIAAVAGRFTVGTLERLTQHPLRETRRAAVLAVGFLGQYSSNAAVGRRLTDVDRQVRTLAENAIRHLWLRDGDAHLRDAAQSLARLNQDHRPQEALVAATRLLRKAPWFAEIWNQRAIAHHNLEHWTRAIADCHQALELNPYHFAAAAGMGQCYLKLNRRDRALECLRRALRLNPDMMGVRACVQYLERVVEED